MRYALPLLLLVASTLVRAQTGVLLAPGGRVDGKSQAEWSQLWWQWAGSFGRSESPIADPSGDRCGARQGDKVWFLAGTYGTHRVIRTCRVPRGRYLFFPLVNYVMMPDGTATPCASVVEQAARLTDSPRRLVLEVDGKRMSRLERYRQASPGCFDLAARMGVAYRAYPSASNGYYVMLKPLAPGRHELNFGGTLSTLAQAVTYIVIVE